MGPVVSCHHMRSCFLELCLTFLLSGPCGGHYDGKMHKHDEVCTNPRGPKGRVYTAGCYKFTCMEKKDMILCINKKNNMFTNCRRTGHRFYWNRELAEHKCCMFEDKAYRPGRLIKVATEIKQKCTRPPPGSIFQAPQDGRAFGAST